MHGFSQDRAFLVRPKVGLEDVLEDSGVVDHDGSAETQDSDCPSWTVLFVESIVQLRDLAYGGGCHEDQVADEGQASGARQLDATGANRVIPVLDQGVEQVETKHRLGSVGSVEALKDKVEDAGRLCSLGEELDRGTHGEGRMCEARSKGVRE